MKRYAVFLLLAMAANGCATWRNIHCASTSRFWLDCHYEDMPSNDTERGR
jgi:hypothetical protein